MGHDDIIEDDSVKSKGALTCLNVGCGNDILDGYINLDAVKLDGVDVVHDLTVFPWPFADDYFEEIRMINVLEHLPDTVKVMEELWRISKDGASVVIRVPYWNCWQSIGDPTHLKSFHQRTLDCFDPSTKQGMERSYYTKARFKINCIGYWVPLLPIEDGRGWFKVTNPVAKLFMTALSTYLSNIIWGLEFELITLKHERK